MGGIIGEKFDRWTVLEEAQRAKSYKCGHKMFLCRCDCGKEKVVDIQNLKSGKSRSCGCITKEVVSKRMLKHGCAKTRLHTIWVSMRERCRCKTNTRFHNYGGRGITVCDAWQDFAVFKEWALVNGYSDDLTIERVNVNLGYFPENCTWIPFNMQARNKTNTVYLEHQGIVKPIIEWCELYGIKPHTAKRRLFTHPDWESVRILDPTRCSIKGFVHSKEAREKMSKAWEIRKKSELAYGN